MAVNVEVRNKNNENNMNLIRRFSRRVNNSGVLYKARDLRNHTRNQSKTLQKKQALRSLRRKKEVDRLIKLGKLPDRRRTESVIKIDEEK